MTCCPTCGNRPAPAVRHKDPVAWADFLAAWWVAYGSRPVSATELFQLPEGQVVHPALTVFGRRLGDAWHSGAVVDGRRVILARPRGMRRRNGRFVHRPATWALEEAP
jgi:hypothetical protein